MSSCIIIDDEQPAIDVLKKYVSRMPELNLLHTFTNPLEAIKFMQGCQVDLIFLDIHMDELSGIEVMNIIGKRAKVIFCTAYSEFAVESYELNAVDYLMKPISFPRFERAISRFTLQEKRNEIIANDYIFVKADQKGKMIRIDIKDIDYIEARSNYVAIHRRSNYILVYSSLKNIESYLYDSNFIRVHKSYLVAESKIEIIELSTIFLKNRTEKIPVSKTFRDSLYEKLRKKLLSK